MIPSPRDADPAEETLYDAERDYFEQLDHYHAWQRRHHDDGGGDELA